MFKDDIKLAMAIELGRNNLNQKNLTVEQLISLRKKAVIPDVIGQRQLLNGSGGNPWFVNDQFITNIEVKINATTPSWRSAAQLAISNFNISSLKSITKIQIREVSEGQNVTITETGTTNSNPEVIADAQAPRYTLMPPGQYLVAPGSLVRIYNNHDYYTLEGKTLAITHELGHIIGLAHTNGFDSDEIQIAGTAISDSFSYMNSSISFNSSFEGFTNNDLIALRTMYPKTVGNWERLTGIINNLVISSDNVIYSTSLVNSSLDKDIQYWNGGGWDIVGNSYPNLATKIALLNGFTAPYYINSLKEVYGPFQYNYASTKKLGIEAVDIAVSGSSDVYIVSESGNGNIILQYNGSNWGQIYTASNPIKISAGVNGGLAYIDVNGYFHIRKEQYSSFFSSQSMVMKEIAMNGSAGVNGHIFALGGNENASGDYQLFRWTGYDWYDIGTTGYNVAVDNQGHPWIAKKNGELYRNQSL
ncbi:M57 family metalloprotease [Pedobacter lithocola]|uniref:M57 family metalloprotease n=1 Tax=Pedobacter lithocola TaxID=1908239 RepID=A0ABV8P500_9SPHI